MMNIPTSCARSRNMSLIRSSNNASTELRLLSIFHDFRISGWRRNFKLLGKPDFVFPKLRVAIFVDGCFWHMCPKHCSLPKSNSEFWRNKLLSNRRRDKRVGKELTTRGWMVVRVWEHELNRRKLVAGKICRILSVV